MKAWLDKILNWPPVAHLMAALTRFTTRLGPQFAGAITYFSVLSLVPILMFSFAMIGMTLTILRPDMLASVQELIAEALGSGPGGLGERVAGIVEDALNNWRSTGVTALVIAAYSGSGWVGNLKKAVRMMWREDPVDEDRKKPNPVLNIAANIVIFLGLLAVFAVGVAIAQAGSSASQFVVNWLGLSHVPGIGLLLRLATILMSFLVSWILMAFLFWVLPDKPARLHTRLVGITLGALLITILQQVAGILIGVFTGNAAASLFGPVIVAMLLMNLLATIVLLMASWVGTDATMWQDIASSRNRASEVAAAGSAVALAGVPEAKTGPPMVRQEVAERGVRAGLGIGYGVGAATGVGIGAVVAAIIAFVAKAFGRR